MSILQKKKLIMLVLKYLPASVPLKVALFLFKNKTARKIVQKLLGRKITRFLPFSKGLFGR
ncbi:hypothetical protein HF984_02775 [Rothia terrae]|uniref:hypothetical protein n=1 Tax=Rothia terrae TaxID=396015 RepID=UPI001447207B|nr:hypothetical protein [Rothia terrae]NKZ33708.1 hypothetical protein [Rothia terrae]